MLNAKLLPEFIAFCPKCNSPQRVPWTKDFKFDITHRIYCICGVQINITLRKNDTPPALLEVVYII